MGRQRPEAHRGPSCSVCRRGRTRVLVHPGPPGLPNYDIPVAVCPECDRVERPTCGDVVDGPVQSASKIRR